MKNQFCGSETIPAELDEDGGVVAPLRREYNSNIIMLQQAEPPETEETPPLKQEVPDPALEEISDKIYRYEAEDEAEPDASAMLGAIRGKVQTRYYFPKKGQPQPVSYERMMDVYHSLRDNRGKMFFLAGYLTGGRVSEVLKLRKMDVKEGLDLKYGKYLQFTLLTEKKRKHIQVSDTRELRVFWGKESELCEDFWQFCQLFGSDELIFGKMDRFSAWRYLNRIDFGQVKIKVMIAKKIEFIVREHFQGFPHFLRHCRLSHLGARFKFKDRYIMFWAGWASMQMTKTYVHTEVEELGDVFFGGQEPQK
jgi:integrase